MRKKYLYTRLRIKYTDRHGPMEPMLDPSHRRLSLFPIKHPDVWEKYQEHVRCFWQAAEVDLSRDRSHFEQLPPEVQTWCKFILAFFNVADSLVMENLQSNFSDEVVWLEAKSFFSFQSSIENIHMEVYSLLVDEIISDPCEKSKLFDAVTTLPAVSSKVSWASQWVDRENASFAERLVAWGAMESILFSASFASIFFIKHAYGTMPGLAFANELISRDEGLHAQFAALLYSKLRRPLSTDRFHAIIASAVEVESQFVCDALRNNANVPNLPSADDMIEYVKYVADQTCVMFRQLPIYNTSIPENLIYMQSLSLRGKANFFERRVSAYSTAPPLKETTDLKLDADF